jgi:hypothetical protein
MSSIIYEGGVEMADLSERIAHHEELLGYELANYERAIEVNSHDSVERALMRAAAHAAILNALRQRESV